MILKGFFAFFLISIFINSAVAETPKKINLAVADFGARGVSNVDAITIGDFFRTEIVSTNLFNVIERNNMEKILEEQKFQVTGCTEQECAVRMGKLLNIEKIIIGSVVFFNDEYYINARVVNVETGEIVFSEKIGCKKKADLPQNSELLAKGISERLTGKISW